MISFIVSAYDRPAYLNACLASLLVQDTAPDILVTLNHPDEQMNLAHKLVCQYFDVPWMETGKMGARCCYSAAELAVPETSRPWLCFPSEDSYYLPRFTELMLVYAIQKKLDLVYGDVLYSRPNAKYGPFVHDGAPLVDNFEKTGFILRREWFQHFPGKDPTKPVSADGMLAESLVQRGIKHGKILEPRGLDGKPPVLVVHN